ncbi:hypothetical protein EV182_000043 [Spiromyces aspiralis]|uniref:Uncharacterized protein n=1 Tax=Spiromyces aspiralis TaxID=68401 RepID=A0ACC1HJ12_9FUNG|nr:hypothetical protein EV182_000043 [Spiromyces aspiralis]
MTALHERIVYNICEVLYRENAIADLKNVSQVSRAWNDAAKPWVWRTFRPFKFDTPHEMAPYYRAYHSYVQHLFIDPLVPEGWIALHGAQAQRDAPPRDRLSFMGLATQSPSPASYQDRLAAIEKALRLGWPNVRSLTVHGVVNWATVWLLHLLRQCFPKLKHLTLINSTVHTLRFPQLVSICLPQLREAIVFPRKHPAETCRVYQWLHEGDPCITATPSLASSRCAWRPPHLRDCERWSPSILEQFSTPAPATRAMRRVTNAAPLCLRSVQANAPSMLCLWKYLYTTLTSRSLRRWGRLQSFTVRSTLAKHAMAFADAGANPISFAGRPLPQTGMLSTPVVGVAHAASADADAMAAVAPSLEIDWTPNTQSLLISGYEPAFVRNGRLDPGFYRVVAGTLALTNGAVRSLKLGAIDESCVRLVFQCCPLVRKIQLKSRHYGAADIYPHTRQGDRAGIGLTAQSLLDLARNLPFLRIIKDHVELDSFSTYRLNYSLLCEKTGLQRTMISAPDSHGLGHSQGNDVSMSGMIADSSDHTNSEGGSAAAVPHSNAGLDIAPANDRLNHLELSYHSLCPEALHFLLLMFPNLHTLSFNLLGDITNSKFIEWVAHGAGFPRIRRLCVGTIDEQSFETLLMLLRYFPSLQVCRFDVRSCADVGADGQQTKASEEYQRVLSNVYPNVKFMAC